MNYFKVNKTVSNLTGNQIAKLFDSITNQILYSLNLFTSVLEINISQLLSWVSSNRKKKVSPINRELQLQLLYYYMFSQDADERYKILKALHLDRFYIRKLAANFLETSKGYTQLYSKHLDGTISDDELLKMSEIESACYCSRLYLYPLILNLEHYLSTYREIADIIISKYYKFLWSLVKKRVHSTSRHFDEDELFQNYISATLKALDRYDPEKGALTSYIQLWIKNNQRSAEESPEYSIAYEVPVSQLQKQMDNENGEFCIPTEDNFSVSLDALLAEGEMSDDTLGVDAYSPEKIKEENDNQYLLVYLAKQADTLGIARLSLGIQEFFDRSTLKEMVIYMRENGLVGKTVNNM